MISLDRLIAALGETDEAQVPAIEDMRTNALAFIETQTRGEYFGPIETFEEILVGKGTRNLWLTHRPAIGESYDGLTVQEYAYAGGTPTDLTEGGSGGFEVRVSPRGGRLVRLGAAGVWTQGHEYVVRYPRGYEIDHGPKDVEDLLVELVRLKWSAPEEGEKKSETIGGYSYTLFDSGDIDSAGGGETIKAWRRPVFG